MSALKETYLLILVLGANEIRSERYPIGLNFRLRKRFMKSSFITHPSYNVTLDCKESQKLVLRCLLPLKTTVLGGYPWTGGSLGHVGSLANGQNTTDDARTLKDPLDALYRVCDIQDHAEKCQAGIPDFCVLGTYWIGQVYFALQFICSQRHRSENLVRSLQCLHSKRSLTMLFFNIRQRCSQDKDILDNIMMGIKNVYFVYLNVWPVFIRAGFLYLYCVPRSSISTCIRPIIDDQCGAVSADLVGKFVLYLQAKANRALESAGLPTDICVHSIPVCNIQKGIYQHLNSLSMSPYFEHVKETEFFQVLEKAIPGSGLDSVWGHSLVLFLHYIVEKNDHCAKNLTFFFAYEICMLSSLDVSEKNRFNILQHAHQLLHTDSRCGLHCSRLECFKACWGVLQQVCGSKARPFMLHATLLIEGCELQSVMDNVGCPLAGYAVTSLHKGWPVDTVANLHPGHAKPDVS